MVAVSEGPSTRLGQIVLAGDVVDDEPIMPSTLRVMDAYVLSVVLDGEGTYRDADRREERIVRGAHTIVPPSFPHWYGTDPGCRWTELFVVFTGPLFDFLVGLGMLGRRRAALPPTRTVDRGLADRAPGSTAIARGCGAPVAGDGGLAARHPGHRR